MSIQSIKGWYSDGTQLIQRLDRWVTGKNPQKVVEQDSAWLGWDAWVRTDNSHRTTHDTPHAR